MSALKKITKDIFCFHFSLFEIATFDGLQVILGSWTDGVFTEYGHAIRLEIFNKAIARVRGYRHGVRRTALTVFGVIMFSFEIDEKLGKRWNFFQYKERPVF